jgi:L-asparagine oxygenase
MKTTTLVLPYTNKAHFSECASQLWIPLDRDPYHFLLKEHAPTFSHCFAPLEQGLEELRDGSLDFLVCSGLPIDDHLPDPPTNGKRHPLKGWVSEMSLLSIVLATGLFALAYEEEKEGALIQEIAPQVGREHTHSNGGTVPLPPHTDLAILHRILRPEFLCLLCLFNPSRIPTLVTPLEELLKHLSSSDLEILGSPRFRLKSPISLSLNNRVVESEPRSLIYQWEGRWEISGNLSNAMPVDAKDEEAQFALAALQDTCTECAKPISLNPGEMLLFNNHRVLHGRGTVEAPRWLQRVYASRSLEALRRATHTDIDCHVFSTKSIVLGYEA